MDAKNLVLDHILDQVLGGLIAHQRQRVLAEARRLDPRLTDDDILQPHDYPVLAGDPRWNYEDGVLAGLLSAQVALRAAFRDGGPTKT